MRSLCGGESKIPNASHSCKKKAVPLSCIVSSPCKCDSQRCTAIPDFESGKRIAPQALRASPSSSIFLLILSLQFSAAGSELSASIHLSMFLCLVRLPRSISIKGDNLSWSISIVWCLGFVSLCNNESASYHGKYISIILISLIDQLCFGLQSVIEILI
ncbi:hypothetical protein KFK09_028354 [Dendrobium nobile]|uniref:Uncharacterized protein n=1 Tax=Dendrobium nobile TaxID=94219 RepID=A0A8T3A3B5_DENNO|nr:hypothetical protein KFK09_028354 [Dendrobium nobile]